MNYQYKIYSIGNIVNNCTIFSIGDRYYQGDHFEILNHYFVLKKLI